MREQIDAAMARHADTETLYDRPYEDNKRVRVCGPFSVESLSPHRVLSTADENQDGTVSEQEGRKQQDFVTMILDNLMKAGVQNTRKAERLTFDRLDPYAGAWLHAAGEYTDAEGKNPPCSHLHRPRARHRRSSPGKGSRQGSGAGRRLRHACCMWLRL